MPAWLIPAIMAAGQAASSLGSRFGGQGGGGQSAMGRPEWWQMQGDVIGGYTGQRGFNQQLTPQYQSQLQNALSGNMGLSPELLKLMFSQGMSQMQPEFSQQRESLQSSLSPRIAGSGAGGAAMAKLLAEQARATQGLAGDVQIQDLLARSMGQRQGLSQMGEMWGTSQNMQNAAMNAWNAWLR